VTDQSLHQVFGTVGLPDSVHDLSLSENVFAKCLKSLFINYAAASLTFTGTFKLTYCCAI